MIIPRARTDRLVIQDLPDETLVFDQLTNKAHCLNRTTALVWKHCDWRASRREPDVEEKPTDVGPFRKGAVGFTSTSG